MAYYFMGDSPVQVSIHHESSRARYREEAIAAPLARLSWTGDIVGGTPQAGSMQRSCNFLDPGKIVRTAPGGRDDG